MDDRSISRPPTEEQRETRPCRSCRGSGEVLEDVTYSASTGELVQAIVPCPLCDGRGELDVFRYRTERRV